MFKTIDKDCQAEIVEKKSKFIANMFYVESQEEAEEKVRQIKKKYFDARHNCYAYSVYTKEGVVNRFSDDGEPQGTAGGPMLNILNSQNITNVVVIVTRYFGGILLGTGGLIRAYTLAVQEAFNNSNIIDKDLGLEVKLDVSYADLEKLKYYLSNNDIKIINSEFAENISVFVEITQEKLELIEKNKNNLNFNVMSYEIIRDKYIKI